MKKEILTLNEEKFYKEKVKTTDTWNDISHLYCIENFFVGKVVVIDSLFGLVDIVEEMYIKFSGENIFTNIKDRYSNINTEEGIELIQKYYIRQFEKNKAKRKILSLSICPTFSCNLACTYCFEKDYCKSNELMTIETLQKIESHFSREIDKMKGEYPDAFINLELFGGEPIQKKNKEIIMEFLRFAREKGCGVSIISNGYELKEFVPELVQYRDIIGEICVTLDGIKKYHDKLRISADKKGSFDKIVEAIDLYLKLGINIRVATNVCKDNLKSLSALFEFYKERGWLASKYFGVYIGRVFSRRTALVPENILYEGEIIEEVQKIFPNDNPKWLQLSFIKVAEYLAKQIGVHYNQDEYGKARYHYCWATSPILLGYYVDGEMNTYRCTTTVADTQYSLGKLEEITYNSYLQNDFFHQNIFSNSECMSCKIGGFCGGGCVMEKEHRGEQVCAYEKQSFDDFIERIFKPRLKELYERIV